ncbi:MAG: rnpA [Bacteroidetes bacterium]|jgi:ribonuclease P protein component|nr:rnpA [Bacteroidota bacterium]MDF2452329.1 rnpA [Bacteroidota bacterium]
MSFTFTKIERLCSKKAIDDLFAHGKSKTQFPFKLIYKPSEFESPFPVRTMFVVPKKKHKRANKRNDIKRRMREVYRLNKHILYDVLKSNKLDLMFICLSNEELEYAVIEKSMLQLMTDLSKKDFTEI